MRQPPPLPPPVLNINTVPLSCYAPVTVAVRYDSQGAVIPNPNPDRNPILVDSVPWDSGPLPL